MLNIFSKFKKGLEKSSNKLGEEIKLAIAGKKINDETLEHLEETLIMADISVDVATALSNKLRKQKFNQEASEQDIKIWLADEIAEILQPCESPLQLPSKSPTCILMAGVNGAGKTTTIGKLASKFKAENKSVMLAAGDTFRAGAVEQLKVWAERTNSPIETPAKEGADPAGVIFTAMQKCESQNIDILIADTAGRLQAREDLMAELNKITRVMAKQDETAPHSTILVIDGTVGQNAISQVTEFKKMANVTGLIITKLDGTAKAGSVISVAEKFKLPIHYVGFGEGIDDLREFKANSFAKALLDITE